MCILTYIYLRGSIFTIYIYYTINVYIYKCRDRLSAALALFQKHFLMSHFHGSFWQVPMPSRPKNVWKVRSKFSKRWKGSGAGYVIECRAGLRHVYQHRLRGRMYNSILASVLCLWFWTTTLVLKPLIHMLVFIKVLKRISSCRATMEESTCNIFI